MPDIFRKTVRYVENGESVSAPVTNRPTVDLEQNVNALREQLELGNTGQSIIAFNVALAAETSVGSPVTFDGAEYGLASVDPASSDFRVDGIVHTKTTQTTGHVVLSGLASIDLSAVTDDTAVGVYYLSYTAGRLTMTAPVWPVPVLVRGASNEVMVFGASQTTAGSSHLHISVTVPHRRTLDTDEGWQPAGLSVPGKPTNATYRYENSAAIDVLASRFLNGATYSVTQFDGDGKGTELDETVVVLNAFGLWWTGSFPPGDQNESLSSNAGGPMTLRVSTFNAPYSTGGVVRSLVSDTPDGPIGVENCDGTDEPTGNLKITFDDDKAIKNQTTPGSIAFKGYENGRVLAGPVVEGLKSSTGTVSFLEGTTSPVDPADPSAGTMRTGVVDLHANINPDGRIVLPQTVRINDARQRFVNGLSYLGLPSNQSASLSVKLRLPGSDALVGSPNLVISVLLYTDGTGTLPALTLQYKRLTRPAEGDSDTPPGSFTSLTFAAAGEAVTAGDYIRIDSSPITALTANEIIFFEISRAGSDGYAGEVGVLDMVGELILP